MKKIYTLFGTLAFGFSTFAIVGTGLLKNQELKSIVPLKKESMLNVVQPTFEVENSASVMPPPVPFFWDSINNANKWVITDSVGAGTGWTISTSNAMPAGLTSQGFAASLNSISDGKYAIVNSDGGGTAGTQNSTLRNKFAINCSGHSGILLEFNEYYRKFSDETAILVSTDSVNWTSFSIPEHAAANVTSANTRKVVLNITSVAGNQSTVWVAFNYIGAYDWFWAVDDIILRDAPANDLRLQTVFAGNYSRVPAEQCPDSIGLYASFTNEGGSIQTNTRLKVTCAAISYSDSSSYLDSISPGMRDTLVITNSVAVLNTPGNYTFNFNIKQSQIDTNLVDNSKTANVLVNDSVYARDNGKYNGQGYGQSVNAFEVGNAFYIQNQTRATSISFAVAGGSNPQQVSCKLYELDFTTNPTSYNQLGETPSIDITPANVNGTLNASNPKFMTAKFTIPLNLAADKYYLATVAGTGVDTLFIASGSDIAFDDTYPFIYGPFGSGGSVDWFSIETPLLVRLNLNDTSTVGFDELKYANIVSVFPNPSSNNITLNFVKSNNSIVKIFNMNGGLVYTDNVSNRNIATIEMSAFVKGVYTLQIVSDKGVATKKIIKQ